MSDRAMRGNCIKCGRPIKAEGLLGVPFFSTGPMICPLCADKEKNEWEKEKQRNKRIVTKKCSQCNGTGKIKGYTCQTCDGEGKYTQTDYGKYSNFRLFTSWEDI